jgi:hypothetical protein
MIGNIFPQSATSEGRTLASPMCMSSLRMCPCKTPSQLPNYPPSLLVRPVQVQPLLLLPSSFPCSSAHQSLSPIHGGVLGCLSKDQDGWLTPIVDPLNIAVEGKHSPEGEVFVLMLYAV